MSAQRASQLVEAGLWLRLSGDHEGAKRLFEQALKLDPTNARARQLLDSPPPQAQAAGAVSNLDWGLATGHAPTPPPVPQAGPPVVKSSSTRPFGESSPAGTHTVRLGEAAAPEIPEVPRFEDPHGEVMITGADDEPPPDNSTLVFGLSGIPVPPVSRMAEPATSGTLVFGGAAARSKDPQPASPQPGPGTLVFGSEKAAPPQAAQTSPPNTTLVFGNSKDAPPQVPPVAGPGSGTLVFGNVKDTPPPVAPGDTPGSGTLVFAGRDAPPQVAPVTGPGGTLVFGNAKEPQPQAPPAGSSSPVAGPANSTLVFGAPAGNSPAPVAASSTLQFGGSPRDQAVKTDPGLPPFAIDEEPPAVKSSSTLQFNFDDMVPGPLPSPPVPQDAADAPQTAWDRSNPRIDISQIELKEGSEGGGFDLISTPPPAPKPRSPAQLKEEVATLLSGAKDLLDLDDHSGAMELISKALELDPADAAALKLKDRSERTLQAMFESKLGDLAQTPRVKLKDDEIIWLNLDHRAGFVLAQIDGSVTFEDLFAVSGMSRLDTARILAQLVEEGVISKG